jgi:hypothetical protein
MHGMGSLRRRAVCCSFYPQARFIDADDVAAAVRAHVTGKDDRVAIADDDTLVLVPMREPTKAEAMAIERAFVALSFEEQSTRDATHRVLVEALAGRSSVLGWD